MATEVRPKTDNVGVLLESLPFYLRRIFKLLIDGLGNAEIAEKLGLSVLSVNEYRRHLKTYLGTGSVGRWTLIAIRAGVLVVPADAAEAVRRPLEWKHDF